jgi:hypothetical protein
MDTWIRRPSAWLPFLVSLAALALVLTYAATSGVAAHEEEGLPARLFQVLMLAEIALIAVFAARWPPARPRQAGRILVAQVFVASLPIVAVLFLESLG